MGMTITKHWPANARGDYVEFCSYCGMAWRRSQLRIDRKGSFVCPDEGSGEDEVALDEQNRDMTPEAYVADPGQYDD